MSDKPTFEKEEAAASNDKPPAQGADSDKAEESNADEITVASEAELAQLNESFQRVLTTVGTIKAKAEAQIERANKVQSLVEPWRTFVTKVPKEVLSSVSVKDGIKLLNSWDDAAHAVEATEISLNNLDYATSNVATTGSGIVNMGVLAQVGEASYSDAYDGYQSFYRAVQRPDRVKALVDRIRQLGLDDDDSVKRDAVRQLEEAERAVSVSAAESPDPLPVLVGLREAIQTVVAELLRRRPNQEKAGTLVRKVASILNQCKRSSLDSDDAEIIGRKLHDTVDELSAAKQEAMNRDTVIELYWRGLLNLESLLDGVDGAKLKAKK